MTLEEDPRRGSATHRRDHEALHDAYNRRGNVPLLPTILSDSMTAEEHRQHHLALHAEHVALGAAGELGMTPSTLSHLTDHATLHTASNVLAVATGASVVVDPAVVLNPSTDRRLGINCDYWWDAPGNRSSGARSFAAGLRDLGVKYLRYPGGEKADGAVFFDSSGAGPTPTLARISSVDWPSNDSQYWSPPGARTGRWTHPIYGFDSFMSDCRAIDGEPVVVIPLDGIYKGPSSGGSSLTKRQAIDNAVAFVKYANVTNKYNVKYWEIGNEPWLIGYMGGQADPKIYAADFAEVAAAMKKVDPSIQVGASGNNYSYFREILATAASSVDFLTIHPYPTYGLNYAQYASSPLSALTELKAARAALAEYPTHASRIWVAVTETAHLHAINDMGSAVITTHIVGDLLSEPSVRFVQFWNTRWIHNNRPAAERESHDALGPRNELTPSGQAVAIWGQALIGPIVRSTSSDPGVITFASQQPSSRRVTLLLVNRSTRSTAVRVRVPWRTSYVRKQLSGTGSSDTAPAYRTLGREAVTNSVTGLLTLPAVSVTLLDFDR